MKQNFSSTALEANLAATRSDKTIIPESHQKFVQYSESKWGIHKRTQEFIQEYNHPFSNTEFVVEQWRKIVLGDFWLYESLEKAEDAFIIELDIFRELLQLNTKESLKEEIIRTLLEFVAKLTEQDKIQKKIVSFSSKINNLWLFHTSQKPFLGHNF